MRVDSYTHFIPKRMLDKIAEVAGDTKDIGKRMRGIPCIYDLDERRRVVEMFDNYAQVLSYPMPPLGEIAPPTAVEEIAQIGNDNFAEICAKHGDLFPAFIAEAPIAAPDAGVRECERAIKDLGALGVQIHTNINGKPLDRPEFEPFFAKMNELGKPIWLHPSRTAAMPDYIDEKKSLYEIWWTLGWSYETAAAISRLVFSKTLDKYPNLKIIVHHFGGIIPMLEGRIGPGWDQLGARTSDEDYVSLRKSLKKRPLDYFKNDLYADTATFGGVGATKCGMEFYPIDKILFASDCPFDPEKGPGYIRETIKILDNLGLSKEDRAKIDYKNLEALTGHKFVK